MNNAALSRRHNAHGCPSMGEKTQLIRVDINCHRKPITAPLTLVLGLDDSSCNHGFYAAETCKNRPFWPFLNQAWRPGYMHFSKLRLASRSQPRHRGRALNYTRHGERSTGGRQIPALK